MRAEIQKSAPFKDLLKSWLLDENAHKYLVFLRPKFPPDFLFSLASLDSFPPGEAIGCCRTREFIDSLKEPPRRFLFWGNYAMISQKGGVP